MIIFGIKRQVSFFFVKRINVHKLHNLKEVKENKYFKRVLITYYIS